MKGLLLFFTLIIAAMLAFHASLQNGAFIQFLDAHPDPRWVPATEYCVGEGYYLFQNLEQAATYFIRIPERYPSSPYVDDAYWGYLQALDDMSDSSRTMLVDEYQKYVDQFPKGSHVQAAQNKIDAYKNGRR